MIRFLVGSVFFLCIIVLLYLVRFVRWCLFPCLFFFLLRTRRRYRSRVGNRNGEEAGSKRILDIPFRLLSFVLRGTRPAREEDAFPVLLYLIGHRIPLQHSTRTVRGRRTRSSIRASEQERSGARRGGSSVSPTFKAGMAGPGLVRLFLRVVLECQVNALPEKPRDKGSTG